MTRLVMTCSLVLAIALSASAAVVSYDLAGVVEEIQFSDDAMGIAVGSLMSGSFSIDINTPAAREWSTPDGDVARFSGAIVESEMLIDDIAFAWQTNETFYVDGRQFLIRQDNGSGGGRAIAQSSFSIGDQSGSMQINDLGFAAHLPVPSSDLRHHLSVAFGEVIAEPNHPRPSPLISVTVTELVRTGITFDTTDLNNVALNWNQNALSWFDGDFDGDGYTDVSDLNKLAINWRHTAAIPVPEQSSLTLVLSLFMLLIRRNPNGNPNAYCHTPAKL